MSSLSVSWVGWGRGEFGGGVGRTSSDTVSAPGALLEIKQFIGDWVIARA